MECASSTTSSSDWKENILTIAVPIVFKKKLTNQVDQNGFTKLIKSVKNWVNSPPCLVLELRQ